jgi:hypothetical protein
MRRFSMLLLAGLILGGAAVLAITAAVACAEKNRGIGILCAVNAVVLVALWSIANWSWRAAGYWKREDR